MPRKVMISAGETSGELYGAMLTRELKKRWPETEVFGIGGPRMQEEGVSLIAPITHVMGIAEVLSHLTAIRRSLKKAKEALINNRPDILVLIDYPDFNLRLAKSAKSAGIPVLYYVSPQVWAWRSGRVKKIAALADRIAVLFPFEVDCYRGTGLPCEFVGHPISERINIKHSKEELKADLGLDPARDVITLLPGSRPSEINNHQHLIREVAEKIRNEFPEIQIVVPLAPGSELTDEMPSYVKVIHNRTREAVASSEASAVTSGTATFETALLGTPMVVFYIVSPLTYYIGRMIIKVKFISLVNLLSNKQVVLELIQKEANSENIFGELKKILTDKEYREKMKSAIHKISDIMKDKKPSERVASIAGEMAGWKCSYTVSSPQ